MENKLKTVKDIEKIRLIDKNPTHPDFINENDLKQEAIKQVKDMNKKGIYGFAMPFIEFHNITKDDLK